MIKRDPGETYYDVKGILRSPEENFYNFSEINGIKG